MAWFGTNKKEERQAAIIPELITGGIGGTSSTITVNEEKFLGLTAAFSIIERIASTIAMLPLKIFENIDSGREAVKHHTIGKLLQAPNEYQTAFDWRFSQISDMLLFGAGISEIVFDAKGNPISLLPLNPQRVEPKLINGKITYKVTPDIGAQKVLQSHQVLINRFFPERDGSWKSPVKLFREQIANTRAVEMFGASQFNSGTNPAGIISGTRQGLNEDAKKTLVERFKQYVGLGNTSKLMILEGDEKFERVQMPNEDAQYLQTRSFNIAEIARIYNVPLIFMNVENSGTSTWGSGIAELSQAFVSYVLQKFCVRIEQEFDTKLIKVDNENQYCKFIMDGLLRSNPVDRMRSYQVGSFIGLYDIDEIREMEDRNPLPNGLGKARMVPVNMQNLSNAINTTDDNSK